MWVQCDLETLELGQYKMTVLDENERIELAIAKHLAVYASTHMSELSDIKERLEDLEATVTGLNKLIVHLDYLKDAVVELKTQLAEQSKTMSALHASYMDARAIVRSLTYILGSAMALIAVGASFAQIWSVIK